MSERIQQIIKALRKGKKRLSHIAWENALKPGSHELLELSETCGEAASLIKDLQRDTERNIPMMATRCIATEKTKDPAGCGVFGIGTNIWFCPKCGIFNTPTHKFCWKCGQALKFIMPQTEPKGEATT